VRFEAGKFKAEDQVERARLDLRPSDRLRARALAAAGAGQRVVFSGDHVRETPAAYAMMTTNSFATKLSTLWDLISKAARSIGQFAACGSGHGHTRQCWAALFAMTRSVVFRRRWGGQQSSRRRAREQLPLPGVSEARRDYSARYS